MKKIVVISGAGISAESGIATFRDSNGLWENHEVMEVASFDGWKKNPALVLEFYNQRRKQVLNCSPNKAHQLLAELEKDFSVQIITQNVDDLHERAGSSQVLHLHGELLKAQSTLDKKFVCRWENDITLNDKCENGSQLRPFIVWFGEEVPLIHKAAALVAQADILLVIGTSLLVYPAANLIYEAPNSAAKFIIDPNIPKNIPPQFQAFQTSAVEGMEYFTSIIYGRS